MNREPVILGGVPRTSLSIPFVRPCLPSLDEISPFYKEIFASGMITTGPYAEILGEVLTKYLNVKKAVAASSCTSGLILTFQALELPEGSEIILPSFTFMASGLGPVWNRFQLRFVDVERDTMNISARTVESAINSNTSAVLAVHQFGNPAPIEELTQVTDKHDLELVFDAAHGFGTLHHKKPIGPYGRAEIFSMSPTKLLVAGEGGIVASNDELLASHVELGRNYGNPGNYDCLFPGMNARMSELHAVLALNSFKMLEAAAQHRNRIVQYYRERLSKLPGIGFQKIAPCDRSSYKDFSIVVDENEFGLDRQSFYNALLAEGIQTRVYYSPVLHKMKTFQCYSGNSLEASLSNTLYLETHALSLPLYSDMNFEEVDIVCEAIENIHHHSASISRLRT